MKIIYNKIILALFLLLSVMEGNAQNWDYIVNSGEYYFGESMAGTEEEADKQALSNLCSMIAIHVSSDFTSDYKQTTTNSNIDQKEYVHQCILTYTSSTLTNCERMVIGSAPKVTVRRWMKRAEISKIYSNRIEKAKDMVAMAKEALERNKIGIALQYYYWAYSLICSVQYPSEVKDDEGHVLVNWILPQMRYILSDIKVSVENRDGDNVDLTFTYKGHPVSELEFIYNDGREMCTGKAKDGKGTMQMIPNFDGDKYHLGIEYEYRSLARGDAEMESVLNVVGKVALPESADKLSSVKPIETKQNVKPESASNIVNVSTSANTQQNFTPYKDVIAKVVSAIEAKRYTDAYKYFTLDGREMYDKLVGYGKGRIIGQSDIHFYSGNNGNIVARGLMMSFSFRNGTKTTFVEDVVFTFNAAGKIDNVAFGLGKDTENDILNKKVAWKKQTREQLMEFLENYKTAYCLKRLDYIRDIFTDDAIIIVGNVTRVYTMQNEGDGRMTRKGKDIISTNRYTKDQYLNNLSKCFRNNEFINIRFTHSDIQKLEKESNKDMVCVQLGQDYNSSSYADQGYLFLMIDMSDENSPFIKVRTWQPQPDPKFGYYNAGDFYDE